MGLKLNKKAFLIIAHRGGMGYALENSFSALNTALKLNADVLEVDLQITKDKQLILMHDPTLNRTTSTSGEIKQMTIPQIEKIKLNNSEKIPLFEQFLSKYGKKAPIMIEIKPKNAEKEVYDLIKKYNLIDNVTLTSFTFDTLINLYELDSNLQLAIHTNRPWSYIKARFSLQKISKMGIEIILPFHRIFSKTFVQKAHEHGMKVYPWTVNDKIRALKLKNEYKIDGIITDFPDLLQTS